MFAVFVKKFYVQELDVTNISEMNMMKKWKDQTTALIATKTSKSWTNTSRTSMEMKEAELFVVFVGKFLRTTHNSPNIGVLTIANQKTTNASDVKMK